MKQELTIKDYKELDFTNPKLVKELKDTVARDLTEVQFAIFLNKCKVTGLNPFKREIWAYVIKNQLLCFIGRDGYRVYAARNNRHAAHTVEAVYSKDTFYYDVDRGTYYFKPAKKNMFDKDRGELAGAFCIVNFKDTNATTQVAVSANEYLKNYPTGTWKDIPETMLKKVAEAQALRMAYPEDLGGTYSEFEESLIVKQSRTEQLKEQYNNEKTHNIIEAEIDTDENTKAEQFEQDKKSRQQKADAIKQASPEDCATEDQIREIEELLKYLKLPIDRLKTAYKHYDVVSHSEMTEQQASKFIMQLGRLDAAV